VKAALDVSYLADTVSEVGRSCAVETAERQYTAAEPYPLWDAITLTKTKMLQICRAENIITDACLSSGLLMLHSVHELLFDALRLFTYYLRFRHYP